MEAVLANRGMSGTLPVKARLAGAVSLMFLLLDVLALDDITTGHEPDFMLEYGTLWISGLWFVVLSLWLLGHKRYVAGAVSLVVLVLAFLALDDITTGSEPDLTNEYWAVRGGLVWLGALAVWLLWSATGPPSGSMNSHE